LPIKKKVLKNSSVVVYTCNPSTKEAKAGRSKVPDQPELHHELKKKNKNKN
jgi:hypothetical protein